MNKLSCQVQLEARSIAVAPITAVARNQRLGDTMLPKLPYANRVSTIVPWVSAFPARVGARSRARAVDSS